MTRGLKNQSYQYALYASTLLESPHKGGLNLPPNKVPIDAPRRGPVERLKFCQVLVFAEISFTLGLRVASRLPELEFLQVYSLLLKDNLRYLGIGGLKFCIALLKCQLVGVQLILVPAVARRNVSKSSRITRKKSM